MKKKTLSMLIALVLVLTCAVGVTLAWLTDQTNTVTNTFTDSNIDITLTESEKLDLQMVPGHTITKDPKATVVGGSEDCYLFVEITKANGFDDYMTYEIASGWTLVDGTSNVYYREVAASEANQDFPVLKDNKVTVKGTVTKAMMDELEAGTVEEPTLSFTAYATQLYKTNEGKFSVAEAWSAAQGIPVE